MLVSASPEEPLSTTPFDFLEVTLVTSLLKEVVDFIMNLIVNPLPQNQCRPMTPPINTVVVKARGLKEAPADDTPPSERKRYNGTYVPSTTPR